MPLEVYRLQGIQFTLKSIVEISVEWDSIFRAPATFNTCVSVE